MKTRRVARSQGSQRSQNGAGFDQNVPIGVEKPLARDASEDHEAEARVPGGAARETSSNEDIRDMGAPRYDRFRGPNANAEIDVAPHALCTLPHRRPHDWLLQDRC